MHPQRMLERSPESLTRLNGESPSYTEQNCKSERGDRFVKCQNPNKKHAEKQGNMAHLMEQMKSSQSDPKEMEIYELPDK